MSWFSGCRAAVVVALCAASAVSWASSVEKHVPSTALAARSSDVIDRAVRALVAREGKSHIRRVWVFPTGKANTVFVHYRTPTVEHLVMVEMQGERIAKLHALE